MTSRINKNNPTNRNPTIKSIRDNFVAAATDIEELQDNKLNKNLYRTIYLEDYPGIDPTGATPCAQAVMDALEWARNNNYEVKCLDNSKFLIEKQVSIFVPMKLDMGLANLITSDSFNNTQTLDHAVWIRGTYPYNRGTYSLRLGVLGPYYSAKPPVNASTLLSGVKIGHDDMVSGQINDLNIDLNVHGFKRNVYIGPANVWSVRFKKLRSGKWVEYGTMFDCANTAGECIVFDDVILEDSYNSLGTSTAFYSPSVNDSGANTNQALDVVVKASSFDYHDVVFNIHSGTFNFFGTFIENNGNKPYGYVTYNPGKARPIVNLWGGVIRSGMNSANPYSGKTPLNGRVSFFEINGACMFTINGMQMPNRNSTIGENLTGTEIVKVTGTPLQLKISVPYDDSWGEPGIIPSKYLNQLLNPSFTSNINGWQSTATNISYNSDGNVSAGSISFTNSLTESIVKQRLLVNAGNLVFFNAWIKAVTITTGTANLMLKYYGNDGLTQVGVTKAVATLNQTNNSWVNKGNVDRPPIGSCYVDVILRTSDNFDGTVLFDDTYAYVME